jgi:hypothetical protein
MQLAREFLKMGFCSFQTLQKHSNLEQDRWKENKGGIGMMDGQNVRNQGHVSSGCDQPCLIEISKCAYVYLQHCLFTYIKNCLMTIELCLQNETVQRGRSMVSACPY